MLIDESVKRQFSIPAYKKALQIYLIGLNEFVKTSEFDENTIHRLKGSADMLGIFDLPELLCAIQMKQLIEKDHLLLLNKLTRQLEEFERSLK